MNFQTLGESFRMFLTRGRLYGWNFQVKKDTTGEVFTEGWCEGDQRNTIQFALKFTTAKLKFLQEARALVDTIMQEARQ